MTAVPSPYDLLPVGVLVARGEIFTYANAAAAAMLGVTTDKLVGQPMEVVARAVLDDEELPWALGLLQAFRTRGPGPAGQWIRGRSGIGGGLRVVTVPGEAPDEWVITLVDADATSPLSEAMVAAAARFPHCRDEQEIYEGAVEAIFQRGYWVTLMVVEAGHLVVVAMRENQRMLELGTELYGIPAEQVRFDLAKVPHVARCFESGGAVFIHDGLLVMDAVHPPEVAKMIREVIGPLRMVDAPVFVGGRPFGLLSVQGQNLTPASTASLDLYARLLGRAVEDVRHQREAAEHQHQVSELQRELVSRERLAAVGQAAGLLSHEARNPLGAILNALAVLRRRTGADEGSRELIEIAEEEAHRLDALVRDLLELARPLEARLRPVAVAQVLDQALAALRQRAWTRPPEVDVELAADLPEVQADPTLLALALGNLLRNALQAGGGAPVRVSARRDGDRVTVAVQDRGPPGGRRAADDPFDPFSLEGARGTGLGLAVVKRVVEAQGATVRAVEGGTRLELSLPSV